MLKPTAFAEPTTLLQRGVAVRSSGDSRPYDLLAQSLLDDGKQHADTGKTIMNTPILSDRLLQTPIRLFYA